MELIDHWPWEPRPDYTKLLAALRRQGDPGYVPFLELFADVEMIAAVVGGPVTPKSEQIANRSALEGAIEQKVKFWHRLGYYAICQGVPLDLEFNQLEAGDTASLPRDQRHWMNEERGLITNWEDFERYAWPTSAEANLYAMEYMACLRVWASLPSSPGRSSRLHGSWDIRPWRWRSMTSPT
jgi:hypothetical protein